jgi:hypothetical protein
MTPVTMGEREALGDIGTSGAEQAGKEPITAPERR